ncbi:MFS transporter [Paenibacillus sp. PvR098]|uniref:MFS transporter n=1 Tax=unclassified Paenibacillus TaxID=185978 RepID=UPI001B7C18AE|nr:MFS family permease [Paenibacillus sp. PvP091]MBP1171241.1 MFS family permease [Paenibacillus sp. PvR098]MBP2442269.1 MFS family permease [Paenibacillus sp. PvP052]
MIRKKTILYILIIIAFIDMFSQLPIISPLAQSLGADPFMIGLAVGAYSLTNMIGNVLAGRWIDRYGARIVLVLGMAVTAALLGMYWFVRTPEQLVVARFAHGLAGGLLVPSAFTLVSGLAESGRQGKNMAISGAAVGFAAIVGPALGGILKAKAGVHTVFLTVAGLMALGALTAWLVLYGKGEAAKPGEDSSMSTTQGWLHLFRSTPVLQSYLGAFTLMFAMGVLTYMLPLKADALVLREQAAGLLLSTFGVVAIGMFLLPTNRVFDRVPSLYTMLAGLVTIAAALLGLSLVDREGVLFAVMAVYGIGFALMFPSMNALLIRHVPEGDRGKAFGLFYAFYSIGVIAGSFTVGTLALSPDEGFRLAGVFLSFIAIGLFIVVQTAARRRSNSP